MNTIKGLILGSAAGLLAIGGAHAADLPIKAKAVEYVRVCSLYGAGFYYIPGTDTCIKIGGYLRADVTFNASGVSGSPAYSGDSGLHDRFMNAYITRSREALQIDTRTASEYGVIRTYAEAVFTQDSYGGSTYAPTALASNLGANTTSIFFGPAGGIDGINFAFVQFAGFTFGRSDSAYATPWAGFGANIGNGFFGGDSTGGAGVSNIQYTAQFGNGVSLTVGADDPVTTRSNLYNLNVALSAAGGTGANAYAGAHMPDFDARVKVDQAWGLWQLSAQLHEVDASYNTLNGSLVAGNTVGTPSNAYDANSANSGHPASKYGFAVESALQIKNIPTGPGDDIKLEATYTKGDLKQVGPSGGGAFPSLFMLNGSSLAFATPSDGVYTPLSSTNVASADGSIHLTSAVGLVGYYNHNWNANWTTSLFGSQTWVTYDSTAKASYCANYANAVAGQNVTYTCNPNFSISEIGSKTTWTPVAGLAISAEAMWFHLNTGFSGTATLSPGGPYATSAYSFKAQNTAEVQLRVQRNF